MGTYLPRYTPVHRGTPQYTPTHGHVLTQFDKAHKNVTLELIKNENLFTTTYHINYTLVHPNGTTVSRYPQYTPVHSSTPQYTLTHGHVLTQFDRGLKNVTLELIKIEKLITTTYYINYTLVHPSHGTPIHPSIPQYTPIGTTPTDGHILTQFDKSLKNVTLEVIKIEKN